MKISVILPTYNEKGNIIPLLQDLNQALPAAGFHDYEFLVIDDQSPDGTGDAVRALCLTIPQIRLIIRQDERGLASAVKRGIQESRGEVLVLMDTDYNHQPADVPRLLQQIPDYDIVVGSRYVKGGWMESSWIRHYLSYFFNLFVSFMLNLKTTDNLSGFIAVRKSFFQEINLDEVFHGFGEFHIPFIWLAHIRQKKIHEIPVIYKDRRYGQSKFKAVENLINYTKTVLRLRKKSTFRTP